MDYAIGDVHGCYNALLRLLDKLCFDAADDTLWLVGDLINRGPSSLEVLTLLSSLGDSVKVTLGNHDLHFLAVYFGCQSLRPNKDEFGALLTASTLETLVSWLIHQPLAHYDSALDVLMVHAGVCPQWTTEKTLALSDEVTAKLQQDPETFFKTMYGNKPKHWQEHLQGPDRIRCIINYLTRMRYIDEQGKLLLQYKTMTDESGVYPWFTRLCADDWPAHIIFGHWASLNGQANQPGIHALDTGCVYGGELTSLCLQTFKRITV